MRRLKINVVVRVNLIEKVTLRKDLRKVKDGALWTSAVRVIQAERMASGRALRQEQACVLRKQPAWQCSQRALGERDRTGDQRLVGGGHFWLCEPS